MKRASTKVFRAAVRDAIGSYNIVSSWTNKIGKQNVRTVGMMVTCYNQADGDELATTVEGILGAIGLTANTRFTIGGYIRGTCSYLE